MFKTAGKFAWGTAKGTARVVGGVAGAAALAGGVRLGTMSTGLAPTLAAAMAGKSLFMSGFKGGSSGKSGGTDKDDVINETSIVGPTGKLLAKVHKQVVAIKGLLIQNDPAAAQREAAFEEEHRHRRLIEALSTIGGGGPTGGPGKPQKSFWEWLKGLMPLLLGALGLTMLPKLIENLPDIFKGIQNAFDKLAWLFEDMSAFFIGLRMSTKNVLKASTRAGSRRTTRPATRRAQNPRVTQFRQLPGRHANKFKPTKGFGRPTVHEKATRTRPIAGARHPHANRVLTGERGMAERGRQAVEARALRDKIVADRQAKVKQAQLAKEQFQRQAVNAREDRIRQRETIRENTRNRIAREQFRAGQSPDKGRIDKSAARDPATLRRLLRSHLQGQIDSVKNTAKIHSQALKVLGRTAAARWSITQRGLQGLRTSVRNLTSGVRVPGGRPWSAGEFDTRGRRVPAPATRPRFTSPMAPEGARTARPSTLANAGRALMANKGPGMGGGVVRPGFGSPMAPEGARTARPGTTSSRVPIVNKGPGMGARTTRPGFGSPMAPEGAARARPTAPATSPTFSNKGPAMGGGARAWNFTKKVVTAPVKLANKWRHVGNVGAEKVYAAFDNKQFRIGTKILGAAGLVWAALDQFGVYYQNVYVKEMKKIQGTTTSHKGKMVSDFNPDNPKVQAARRGLFKEIRRIVPVLAIAIAGGFIGMKIGAWVGALIGGLITALTGGLGAIAIPLLGFAGGLVGGIWGFTRAQSATNTEIGQQVTTALADKFVNVQYNDQAVVWVEKFYTFIVTMENNKLKSWVQKRREARGLAVEGQVPDPGQIRAALRANRALTPDFHNVNTEQFLKTHPMWASLTPDKIDMLLGGEPVTSVKAQWGKTGNQAGSMTNFVSFADRVPASTMTNANAESTPASTTAAAKAMIGQQSKATQNESTLKSYLGAQLHMSNTAAALAQQGKAGGAAFQAQIGGINAIDEKIRTLLATGRFSKRVTVILANTQYNNVNVPHILNIDKRTAINTTIGVR